MFVSLTMKRLSTESNIRRLLNVYGKPRHRWERHKLDKKSGLESKRTHENIRRVVTGYSHQKRSTTRLCVITLSV